MIMMIWHSGNHLLPLLPKEFVFEFSNLREVQMLLFKAARQVRDRAKNVLFKVKIVKSAVVRRKVL